MEEIQRLWQRIEPTPQCKKQINRLFDQPESSSAAQVMHYSMICLICAGTAVAIVDTMPEYESNSMLVHIEMCITLLFTIELALRLYACDSVRVFMSNGFNIIDVLAIFPGYLALLVVAVKESDQSENVHKAANSMRTLRLLRIFRLLRVFRVSRLAKVARYSESLGIVFAACVKVSQSGLVVVLMLLCSAMILSASLIYIVESELCDDAGAQCSGFVSIPRSFWWAIATLTTVGYGDMVPQTSAGKVIGSFTAIAGVIILAIGIALVSINFNECFIEEQARAEAKKRTGPAWPESGPQDKQEIDEALSIFNQSSDALLSKLQEITSRQEDGAQLSAMLDILTSHNRVLSSDVLVLVDHLFAWHDARMNEGEPLNLVRQMASTHAAPVAPGEF